MNIYLIKAARLVAILLALVCHWALANDFASNHWVISNLQNGFSYDTSTQLMAVKGLQKKGLISAAKKGDNLLLSYWQEGAYRPTITYNQATLIDGFKLEDVSRISSFRFDEQGNFVYIRTAKGPKVKVKLIFNGVVVLSWPRLTKVKVLSFNSNVVITSIYDEQLQQTTFSSYDLTNDNNVAESKQALGSITGCDVLSTKVIKTGIYIQSYCKAKQGSDVLFLDLSTHQLVSTQSTQFDEYFGMKSKEHRQLVRNKEITVPILTVSGSSSSRQLFHAISGSFSQLLGEPMAMASDEAGKQSWSQSYRTLALAELYHKTKHPVFARLAAQAMYATLRQQNQLRGIAQEHNPRCGWASRIYSIDSITPISFMINQAMITNSLVKSCAKLEGFCSDKLKRLIDNTAVCLVDSYEYLYVEKEGLYRIPYGSKFRYDGILAPWNWHLTWVAVLQHAGKVTKQMHLKRRALAIVKQFTNSWQFTDDKSSRALWRYWTPHYYQGWTAKDKVSVNRPKQRPAVAGKTNYEDLNHAGLSLMGLNFIDYSMDEKQQLALESTIDYLLDFGAILPKFIDGNGPLNPRWSLGAGWHAFATPELKSLFQNKLPGAVSSNKHLAYAFLGQGKTQVPSAFDLTFTLSYCSYKTEGVEQKFTCQEVKVWTWHKIEDFLSNNPLFKLTAINTPSVAPTKL